MDDGAEVECVVVCCLACCEPACDACADSRDFPCSCACILAGLAALALAAVLVAAFAFVVPVRVSVDEATLGRLALLNGTGTNGTGNGTGAGAAEEPAFAYDISLAVALRNPNWAMRAWRTGPLDAELRFRGTPFARARLAGTERDRIRPRRREVYRVAAAAAESAPMALGSDGAAEFARQRAAGVFDLELVVSGEARYEAHLHRRGFKVSCPLRVAISTATAPAAFARVKCS